MKHPTKFEIALAADPQQEATRVSRGDICDVCDVLGCCPLRHSISVEPLTDAQARTFARNLVARPAGEPPRALLLAEYIDSKSRNRPVGTKQCCALAVQLHAHGNACVLELGHAGKHQNWQDSKFERSVEYSDQIHDAIVAMCRCGKHKRYRARGKPTSGCESCWRLWILTHPSYDLESRWMR